MNHVGATVFQNRKATIEEEGESSENFEMNTLYKGALDKVLMVIEKTTDAKSSRKTTYEVIYDKYSENLMLNSQKSSH